MLGFKGRKSLLEDIKMVKHVILWTLKDEFSDAQKADIKKGIKEGLEGLKGQIPGMIDIKVNIDPLHLKTRHLLRDMQFTQLT